MPPITFIQASGLAELTSVTAGGTTPSFARPGDILIAAIGCFDARNIDATISEDLVHAGITYHIDPTAWTILSRQIQTNDVAMLLRHVVTDAEPAAWGFGLTGVSTHLLQGALLLYRSIDAGAALIDSHNTAIAAATNWNAPSVNLTHKTDLFLGLHYCRSAGAVITAGSNYTNRYHNEDGGGSSSILIADWHLEATGASGTKPATTAGNQSGIVASYSVQSTPAPQFTDAIDPTTLPCGIGFFGKTLANPT